MRIARLLKISAVATLVAGLSVATLAQPATAASSDVQTIINGQDGINDYRAAAHVGAVSEVQNLDTLAQARAEQGARDGMIQHDANYWNYNLPGVQWGETLVNGYGLTSDAAATAWELSNAHRPIMEGSQYTQVGVGWAVAADGQAFAVAIFVPTTTVNAPRPGTVQDVLATKTGEREISASWSAPASSSPFNAYQVSLTTLSNSVVESHTVATTTTNYVFSNLNRGKSYIVHVTASNNGVQGNDAQSNAVIDIPATAPVAPTQLTGSKTGDDSVRFTWTAPNDNGGSSLTGYTVDLLKDGVAYRSINTTDSAASFENLVAGANYSARVRASNSIGSGTYSTLSAAIALPVVAQASAPATVQGVQLNRTASGQVSANWMSAANADYYIATLYRNGIVAASKQTPDASVAFDIAPGQEATYTFVVRAFNALGASAASNVVQVAAPVVVAPTQPVQTQQPTAAPVPVAEPTKVVPPVAAAPSQTVSKPATVATPSVASWSASNGVSLTWKRPNGTVNGYDVLIDGRTLRHFSGTKATITGLSHTTHTLQVRATNTAGKGAYSAKLKVNLSLPGKVATPGVSAAKKSSVKVTWRKPSANGNDSINRYLVRVYRYTGGKYVYLKQVGVKSTATKPATTITGLKAHTKYYVQVEAFNTRGSSSSYSSTWHGAYSTAKKFATKR
jgi:hypothetical protein